MLEDTRTVVGKKPPSPHAVVDSAWREVLGVPSPAMDDDFFAQGGHSLLAIRFLAKVASGLGRTPPFAEFLAAPTPGSVIDWIAGHPETLPPASARMRVMPFPMVRSMSGMTFARVWPS